MATCCGSVATLLTTSAVSNFLVVVINPLKLMNTKTPECWSSDPNARAVKIEISSNESLLLPFDQFAFAELNSEGKEQRLRLVFATHEVVLNGHSLRRIEIAMQRMELAHLAKLPSRQQSLIADAQAVILEIVVTETAKQESPATNPSN